MCLHNFSILKKFRISVNPISLSIFSIFRFRRRTAGTTRQVARELEKCFCGFAKKVAINIFCERNLISVEISKSNPRLSSKWIPKELKRKLWSSRRSLEGSRNVPDLKKCGSLKKENCFYDAVERFRGGCGFFLISRALLLNFCAVLPSTEKWGVSIVTEFEGIFVRLSESFRKFDISLWKFFNSIVSCNRNSDYRPRRTILDGNTTQNRTDPMAKCNAWWKLRVSFSTINTILRWHLKNRFWFIYWVQHEQNGRKWRRKILKDEDYGNGKGAKEDLGWTCFGCQGRASSRVKWRWERRPWISTESLILIQCS